MSNLLNNCLDIICVFLSLKVTPSLGWLVREDAAANKHDCDGYLGNETTMNTTENTRN